MRAMAAALVLLAAIPAATADELQQAAQTVMARNRSALAVLQIQLQTPGGPETAVRLGLCVHAEQQILLTVMSVPSPPTQITGIQVVRPWAPREPLRAELMGTDLELGLGFVRCTQPGGFTAVEFAQGSTLEVGEPVFPLSLLPPEGAWGLQVGFGRIAAKLRMFNARVPGELAMLDDETHAVLLTPLPFFDAEGRMIGFGSPTPGEGTDLFMLVDEFAHLLTDMPTGGQVRRYGWIGLMRPTPVGAQDRARYAQLANRPGLLAEGLVPGQPAAEAGLRQTDVIVGVGGQPLEAFPTGEQTARYLLRQIARTKPGETLQLTVLRDGQEQPVQIPVVPIPTLPQEAAQYTVPGLGVVTRDLTLIDRFTLEMPASQPGALVAGIDRQSPVVGRVQPGDVITQLNDRSVTDVSALRAAIDAAMSSPSTEMVARILRGGEPVTVSLPKPRG